MKLHQFISFLVLGCWQSTSIAAPPTTDPAMDVMLGLSHAPATQPAPATQLVTTSPFSLQSTNDQKRAGQITLSNGKVISGKIATTDEKPIRVWVEKEKRYEDIPFDQIKSARALVIWERMERDCYFKEAGSDVKVYSGQTYPARQTQYKFTLNDGTIVEGDCVAALYVTFDDGQDKTFVLYKRDKGNMGQTLGDRPYVKTLIFR